ncbi:minichromosome maintenance protein MCM [Candidatus Woesearchaeota archaeon]|nr:minichromosome maintenance protein MCM [Candidatus Woesearchaeota archaeon]
MEATELINRVKNFLEKNYYAELSEQVRKHENFLIIQFPKLSQFDPDLADYLLETPEEFFKAAEIAIEQFDMPGDSKNFIVRFIDLPDSCRILIRNIRSKNLNKFLFTEGIVRNKTDVRPKVTAARFECPSCGNTLSVLQLDKKFKEPSRCSCGRKGKFRLLSKELMDAQGLILEEIPEQIEGGAQPKRLNVFLKNDLVSPLSERRTNPGARIVVSGIIKEVPKFTHSGVQSTDFDIMLEGNSVVSVDEDFSDVNISEKEMKIIKDLSKDKNLIKKLVGSAAPSIYGHEKIKEALILQLTSGVRKVRDDGIITRGDMHILLIGDPGAAKSQMLKRMSLVAPKAKYVTGKGASGAGLSASVVKDEFLGGWSLEAGALVLANKGIVMIDELDKMTKEDAWAMHEALEQQSISISKANIQATLRCETAVLAAANPKFGRFDPFDTVANQINLPSTLINRFDLIFAIKDLPNKEIDEKMAKFILSMHQSSKTTQELDTNLLRKYLSYVRLNIKPKLTDSAIDELRNYYIKMRSSASDKGIKSVPISARQLEGLVRLSEAYAKLRLSDKVAKKDAQNAVELLDYCLKQIAFDEETGTIDIDRIATSMPASQRNKIIAVKEILVDLENKLGKTIPLEDVVAAAKEKNFSEAEVEEIIQKLKNSGDIFEPRHGFISRI